MLIIPDLFGTPIKLCYNLKCEMLCLPPSRLTLSRSRLGFNYGHGYSTER
jgi:hypothetical protein